MSQTRAQKKKLQKVVTRRKVLVKKRNIRINNIARNRFRLDVLLDGVWNVGVREWSNHDQIKAHNSDVEMRRARGEEIAPGRIVDTKFGKVVMTIDGSRAKGAAPDKIAHGAKATAPIADTQENQVKTRDNNVTEPIAET
jgi:hypothetical protein